MAVKKTQDELKNDFLRILEGNYAVTEKTATPLQSYQALATVVKQYSSADWRKTKERYAEEGRKQMYYFSIEYLPGRYLRANLLNLGLLDDARAMIKALGLDFDALLEAEVDQGLGNGGLGRLASDFMDSMPSINLAGHGVGIRYRYGLFRQEFINGYQVEYPDDWLKNDNIWEVRQDHDSQIVHYGGTVYMAPDETGELRPHYEGGYDVLAVPYDTGMIGADNGVVNTLRLWSAEVPEHVTATLQVRSEIESISGELYPDDSNEAGRRLRLRQEYFFSSAGIQAIVTKHLDSGKSLTSLPHFAGVHINDTHPTVVIPELMRIFMDEHHMTWDEAWHITREMVSYTNHTLMAEALEVWPEWMVEQELPRIYQIIQEVNRRFRGGVVPGHGDAFADNTAPISNGMVHMARLAVIGSKSVNGVAPIHSKLLKEKVLHDLYELYPEKFSNKTNGITMRRYMHAANEPISKLIDSKIGKTWRKTPTDIKRLMDFEDDGAFLQALLDTKHENKVVLAKWVQAHMGITLHPDAMFDVQIKRLHAYKRQLLHLFGILRHYLDLIDNPGMADTWVPKVHIFAAKAAPSYTLAKQIIKVINETANMINNDSRVNQSLQVVFLPNYSVSMAEMIIPAADISEQISTAGKEASGTSNMKLMANGALQLATRDGANIEIFRAAGEENNYPFGLTTEEIYNHYDLHDYNPWDLYNNNHSVHRVVNALIDGTIPNIAEEGQAIFDSLLKYGDEYFVLADFNDYIVTRHEMDRDYQDKQKWAKKMLANIANSGEFSADYTVAAYADDIWHMPHDQIGGDADANV
jgi:starch phosphorylase